MGIDLFLEKMHFLTDFAEYWAASRTFDNFNEKQWKRGNRKKIDKGNLETSSSSPRNKISSSIQLIAC